MRLDNETGIGMNPRRLAIACLSILCLFQGCHAPGEQARTGSWGDQGDGTFRNPVLNGDYPDVDIEQVI